MNGSVPATSSAADYRVLKRQFPLAGAPVELFAALTGNGTAVGNFLLETADSVAPDVGKSFLLLSPCLKLQGRGQQVELQALTLNGKALLARLAAVLPVLDNKSDDCLRVAFRHQDEASDEMARLRGRSPFDALRAVLNSISGESSDDARALLLTGIFPFESIELFEQFSPFEQGSTAEGSESFTLYVPEISIQVPRDGHPAQASAIVFAGAERDRVENELSRRLALIAERAAAIKPVEVVTKSPDVRAGLSAISTDIADKIFCQQVDRVKEHLRAGDAFQIVISRRFQLPCPAPLAAYRALRQENPSPYLFYGNTGGFTLFGASPESAVKVDGATGLVEVCPIAGTRARGRNGEGNVDFDRDARIEAELRADAKEVAEHMMLVDLARNDVARICQPGTRRVKQLLSVERYARVMHLVSRVTGVLKPELDALHAFAASMPMGTLSGAPKIRAIEIIRGIERQARGCYGGAVGYLDAAGNMDTAIVIRAAVVRDGMATVQAGAGVVLGSDPQAEADETRRKAESVLRAIATANHFLSAEHSHVA